MSLENLFKGDVNFKKQDGEVPLSSLSGEGKVLGMYFSAHWCPPCRAFTPQLAEWYKKFKKTANGDKLDIVFLSSDRDEKTFDEYYAEMPWLALPYDKRDLKTSLSQKFKVSGIPTLVFVNGNTGALVTSDGRSIIMDDPDGAGFPWNPKTFSEIIPGKLVNKEKEEKTWGDVDADVIGLYFSAHWCGPCRAFTPQLVKTYNKIKEDGKKFELIFVSSDRDQEAMDSYLREMPWWAIPFGDARKKVLSRRFDISGIPSLIILKKDGKVISNKGRAAVSQDPDGKDFPWFPKPVNPLTGATAGDINEFPSLIWFNKDKNAAEGAKTTLKPIAEKWIAAAEKEECDDVRFFYYSEDDDDDDIGSSLKSFASVGEATLVLIDIPSQKVYCHDNPNVTAEEVNKVLGDYKESKLKMRPIKS